MIDAREQKVKDNDKLVTDTEAVVIKTIKVARSKLTGIKMKFLKFKDGPHVLNKNHKVPDFEFPKKEELSYDDHIVGFMQKPGDWNGFNIIMSYGEKSNLPEGGKNLTEVKINPVAAIVKKIVMWGDDDHSDHEFGGV